MREVFVLLWMTWYRRLLRNAIVVVKRRVKSKLLACGFDVARKTLVVLRERPQATFVVSCSVVSDTSALCILSVGAQSDGRNLLNRGQTYAEDCVLQAEKV